MNRNSGILIIISIAFLVVSCSQPKGNNWRSRRTARYKGILRQWAIDDTISLSELKKNTILNLSDYPGTHQFQFDTVYYPESRHPFVIITCDENRVCMDYFLLVFNGSTQKNTAVMQIKRDCDTDGDMPQTDLDFKVISDSLFCTEDVYVKNSENDSIEDVRKITAKHYFRITDDGTINATKRK